MMALTTTTLAIGTKLTIKPDQLHRLYVGVQRKVDGRIGEVVAHTYPSRHPIVAFPTWGGKKDYRFPVGTCVATFASYFDIAGEYIEMEVA